MKPVSSVNSVRPSCSILVNVDSSAIGLRQESVDLISWRIKRNGMCTRLRRHGLQKFHRFSIDNLNHARIADSHIQVLERRVEENHVRDAADIQRS